MVYFFFFFFSARGKNGKAFFKSISALPRIKMEKKNEKTEKRFLKKKAKNSKKKKKIYFNKIYYLN